MAILCVVSLGLISCNESFIREPRFATVTVVIDGDTIEIDTGERIRYLMVDTPELAGDECWSIEARDFNKALVLGKRVRLTFDLQRVDKYQRLLAYVSLNNREINTLLVERGYARVLHIPPNGKNRLAEFKVLEQQARSAARGMWGGCPELTCN